jgi:hypothetical protein
MVRFSLTSALIFSFVSAVAAQPPQETPEPAPQEALPQETPPEAPPQPPAPPAVPPVVVVPVTALERQEPFLGALVAERLRALLEPAVVRRSTVIVTDPAALTAANACTTDPTCLGGVVASANGMMGVIVRTARRNRRAPLDITLEVIDPVSGAPRLPAPLTASIAATAATPETVGADPAIETLAGQIRGLMPPPPPRTTILIASNVDGAQVRLDNEVIGETPMAPVEVEPGSHVVQLNADGFSLQRRTVEIGRGDAFRIDADLEADAQTRARDEAGEPLYGDGEGGLAGDDEGSVLEEWWFWTAVGGGAVLLITGGILIGVLAAGGDDNVIETIPVPRIR